MKSNVKPMRRQRRHHRIRKRVRGSASRPRLAVYRSNTQIYAQLIDDDQGRTLASASSLDDLPEAAAGDTEGGDTPASGKIGVAERVGRLLAERATAAGIEAVVFDRGGFRYSGRVKALADGARSGGLKF